VTSTCLSDRLPLLIAFPHHLAPGWHNSSNLPENATDSGFPAYSLLISGILQPGFLENLGIL
jgi:hypothetical protein